MIPHIVIRKTVPEDLPSILRLSQGLFENDSQYDPTLNGEWTYSEEGGKKHFASRIADENSYAVLALEGEKAVGYIIGNIRKIVPWRIGNKNYAELENIFVIDSHRNKGVGTELISGFRSWCREKDVGRIALVTECANKKAQALYQKLGFKDYLVTLEQDI